MAATNGVKGVILAVAAVSPVWYNHRTMVARVSSIIDDEKCRSTIGNAPKMEETASIKNSR